MIYGKNGPLSEGEYDDDTNFNARNNIGGDNTQSFNQIFNEGRELGYVEGFDSGYAKGHNDGMRKAMELLGIILDEEGRPQRKATKKVLPFFTPATTPAIKKKSVFETYINSLEENK